MARNNSVQVQVQNRSAKNNNNNNNTSNGGGGNGGRGAKYYGSSPKYFKSITPPMSGGKCGGVGGESSPRLSPSRVTTPPTIGGGSPRTSPGLLAGHYAGCKFTEPPLPSALPPPPQHWMQQPHARAPVGTPCAAQQSGDQLANQLKLMLKVQAWDGLRPSRAALPPRPWKSSWRNSARVQVFKHFK